MADPGFSPGGCANSQNCYYFSNFCRKLHENERIWTLGGVPGAPLDPPMVVDTHVPCLGEGDRYPGPMSGEGDRYQYIMGNSHMGQPLPL